MSKLEARPLIPEALVLSRLAQSEQMREFFIQMWLQNPMLAGQGGAGVRNLLAPLATRKEEVGSGSMYSA